MCKSAKDVLLRNQPTGLIKLSLNFDEKRVRMAELADIFYGTLHERHDRLQCVHFRNRKEGPNHSTIQFAYVLYTCAVYT